MKNVTKRTEEVNTSFEQEGQEPTMTHAQDRALTLIEEQLPIAIALGRESTSHLLIHTLHGIAVGHSIGLIGTGGQGYPPPNSAGCDPKRGF